MSIRSVESRCPQRVEEAKQLALLADAVHSSSSMTTDEYRIVLFDDREELWDCRTRKHGMALSFRSVDRRVGAGNLSHKQPLGRAIGSKAQIIVDATAGFGHDASRLACMGWDVIGIERDHFLSVVLKLSLEDVARCDELQTLLSGRLSFLHGDATTVLNTLNPDVIYLDPMFTPRKKRSALPKKPAQYFKPLPNQVMIRIYYVWPNRWRRVWSLSDQLTDHRLLSRNLCLRVGWYVMTSISI